MEDPTEYQLDVLYDQLVETIDEAVSEMPSDQAREMLRAVANHCIDLSMAPGALIRMQHHA